MLPASTVCATTSGRVVNPQASLDPVDPPCGNCRGDQRGRETRTALDDTTVAFSAGYIDRTRVRTSESARQAQCRRQRHTGAAVQRSHARGGARGRKSSSMHPGEGGRICGRASGRARAKCGELPARAAGRGAARRSAAARVARAGWVWAAACSAARRAPLVCLSPQPPDCCCLEPMSCRSAGTLCAAHLARHARLELAPPSCWAHACWQPVAALDPPAPSPSSVACYTFCPPPPVEIVSQGRARMAGTHGGQNGLWSCRVVLHRHGERLPGSSRAQKRPAAS